jgi:hypothetical protein
MIAHVSTGMKTLLISTLLQMSNTLYIASCVLVSILMYILNINNRTRYSNIWLRPQQYNKLQRYLKQWRFMLAYLNRHIYSKQLSWKPYGYRKRQRAHMARTQCLNHRPHRVDPVNRFSMQSTTPTPHRVHFDSDSYGIFPSQIA